MLEQIADVVIRVVEVATQCLDHLQQPAVVAELLGTAVTQIVTQAGQGVVHVKEVQ